MSSDVTSKKTVVGVVAIVVVIGVLTCEGFFQRYSLCQLR